MSHHKTYRPRLRGILPSLVAALFTSSTVLAAEDSFKLGTIDVVGSTTDKPDENTIDKTQLETFNKETVSAALSLVPGTSTSRNSRNEDIIYLRGFDARQVPLYIDGIPAYVPYDGYVDFSRFTTFDLSEIRVSKGAASLLYGPNTLGGAINLVTKRPKNSLEGDVTVGFASGGGRKTAVNLGSNQGVWYLQASASYSASDNFPLSSNYKAVTIPTSGSNSTKNMLENGSSRENAYQSDRKISLKLGVTPNATDEYAVGYVSQHGVKGNPPYAGNAPGQYLNIANGANSRFWQWPYWDVDSIYLLTNTALNNDFTLKSRVYWDNYSNKILAFTDGNYATQISNTSNFPSWYDDITQGASVELATSIFTGHDLHFAVHYKQDLHKDSGPAMVKHYRDVTTSYAVEDAFDIAKDWRLRVGASHDKRDASVVYYWPTGSATANNWLAELSHALTPNAEVFTSLARKTRFPTIKDRYSASLGSGLPNADLKPERALNFEMGIKGKPWGGAQGSVSFFQNRIKDLIQSVNILPLTSCGASATSCSQKQNVGDARHRGLEFNLTQQLGDAWTTGGNYTYLERDNMSNAAIPLTDTPRNKLFAYIAWKPSDNWEYQATLDAESGRKVAYGSGTSATYATMGSFTLLGAKASYKPRKDTTLEVGVSNLTDENYALSDGYPMPGQMWFANAKYQF
ncbi:MAG TPA: TonB-dependent receptor [Rhodocyclaceae bacterium]|jgi:iron complex outermembrane receptor protein